VRNLIYSGHSPKGTGYTASHIKSISNTKLKRLPRKTDFCLYEGYKFEVLDLEGVRVEQLLVTRLNG
jgi:Mg2+/Co2+ transporter CorC|tara:strand:+ start:1120 stop:1320 length:201 start_codon:yes stop_codon:yes gene_type:complete